MFGNCEPLFKVNCVLEAIDTRVPFLIDSCRFLEWQQINKRTKKTKGKAIRQSSWGISKYTQIAFLCLQKFGFSYAISQSKTIQQKQQMEFHAKSATNLWYLRCLMLVNINRLPFFLSDSSFIALSMFCWAASLLSWAIIQLPQRNVFWNDGIS